MKTDMQVKLGPLTLKNPVMTASGTFGHGKEYQDYFDISTLGAVVVKGIAVFPSEGNPTPRVAETSSGMLNAIGLQGPGVEKFCTHPDYLPFLRKVNAEVIVNIWGKTIEQYGEVAERLDSEPGISALEVNISCPNVKAGGAAFGTDPKLAEAVIARVRKSTKLPVIAKLSPNVTDITEFARVCSGAGADILSLINTITGMSIDAYSRKPRIANVTGGLSGPAVKPVALRMVWQVAKAVSTPIIGMGGIMNGIDAAEFMLAGASAVAVGTAIFADPLAPVKVMNELDDFCATTGVAKVSDLTGKLEI